MTMIILGVLMVVQVSCLVIGIFQGTRYIKTEPLWKGGPWLLVAMALSPLMYVLAGML